MFATLAPTEPRRESSAGMADQRKAHRAVRIAANTVVTVAVAAFAVTAISAGVIGLRVVLYALGHADMPFFRDLLASFSAGQ